MSDLDSTSANMRTVRFHGYGEPADVLKMDHIPAPQPGPGRIRVVVRACGLNPADWALCRGLFAALLPRGIGLDVSGVVDAVGAGVVDVAVGDSVMGSADYAGGPSAGASDRAVMDHWCRVPSGLDLVEAAAIPLATETACRSLDLLAVQSGQTLLVHGAGTTVGFAAVQLAKARGARVLATAGNTYAETLRTLDVGVTAYGDGMVERVLELAKGTVDLVLDTGPASGVLPHLVEIAGGEPRRVVTVSDFAAAVPLGVRTGFGEAVKLRWDMLPEVAQLAAEGKFRIPIARTFPLEDWRAAMEVSLGGRAGGKLMLLPAG